MPPSEQHAQRQSASRQDSGQYHDSPVRASPSSLLGLKHPRSRRSSFKTVSIFQEPETISPLILGSQKQVDSECDLEPRPGPRKLSIKGPAAKRLSGRLPIPSSPTLTATLSGALDSADAEDEDAARGHRSVHHHLENLIDQVSQWIKDERSKRSDKKSNGSSTHTGDGVTSTSHHERSESNVSQTSFDLDKLEEIIKYNLSLERKSRQSRNRSPSYQRRKSSLTKAQRKQSFGSSDTETAGYESDVFVPSCDAVLDNSQTLSYAGGVPSDSDSSSDELERTASYKDQDAWAKFKFEIVRLTHTLRLKGWRRVPMNMSNGVGVERLSGALTNAVYVVTPPAHLPQRAERDRTSGQVQPKNPPPKLLLRIYGAQVDHLIDREAELAILRRLAKKKIGPCLLGTFANGRFEEYLYAQPLTPEELRNPDTSRQIAKRMRELHDGIELLDQERNDGAFVWRNWDKWVGRVEQIVCWLDQQILRLEPGAKPTGTEAWKRRGFICGGRWKAFRATVEKYRAWLEAQYGGPKQIRERLVFSHNDTQYGNILRLMPTGDSPLLLPANTHKQLVVIDFEYANANLPGLEFANHFTEWCYNYHDARKPYAFHAAWYPTPEEQDRFVRAYVRHRPQFNANTPKLEATQPASKGAAGGTQTPPSAGDHMSPSRRATSSLSDFMLDMRSPPAATAGSQHPDEAACKEKEDRDVARLIYETRMWRLANTAQWVAWGIVQAKVPGMPDFGGCNGDAGTDSNREKEEEEDEAAREDLGERADVYKDLTMQQQEAGEVDGEEKEEAEEEFDYLGYAQHRAMFFWADAIQFGFAKEQDLPEEMRAKMHTVSY